MVIYPSGFITSEAAASQPLTHARIGYQTHIRDQALTASALTASTEHADGPADSILREDTFAYWEPTSSPATLVIDFGAFVDVDYVGVVGRIGSVGASLLVETNDGTQAGSPDSDLADVYTTFAAATAPGNDGPLLFLDDSVNIRKIKLTTSWSGSDAPRIAVVYAGEVLKLTRPIYGGVSPGVLSRTTTLKGARSRGGQFLGQDYRRLGVETTYAFRHLEAAWIRSTFKPFILAAEKYPFFIAWRPEDYPLEVDFGWAMENIRPANMGIRSLMNVSVPVLGWGYEG